MRQRFATVLVLLLLTGCGTTTIYTTDAHSTIWVDGVQVGHGHAEVRKRGLPGTSDVQVRTEDGRSVRQSMSRSFTGWTALLGLVTYGVGLFACWEYPDAVFVDVGQPAASGYGAPDPWLTPPAGWSEGTSATAPPASTR